MSDISTEPTHLPDGQDARVVSDEQHGESPKAVIAAVLANIAIGIVKFIAAFISGSSAMVSEGIHSIVDSGNGLLILFGMKRAERKPDLAHPFGYSQELYFWTLVVAVMIFALGGGFSMYEGISHILHITPETTLGDPTLNYVIIAISAVIEGVSLSVALREFNAARGDVSPLRFIREAKDPSLFTVVLEDSAAEIGLLLAFLGTLLGHLTGNPYFDGIASVLIGVLLACVAIILLRETKGLIIGEGLNGEELRQLARIVEANPNVRKCGRILTLYLGPHDLLVTIDVTFEETAERSNIDHTIDAIERAIVSAFPQTTRIFIEPEDLELTQAAAKRATEIIEAAD
ncbi:MAG: cation diffusion facilitator family transporter [Eggerthellaceae bacterium]|nr:cation diffusion facilitator family transporter [Eggerthellaceae bacterium]